MREIPHDYLSREVLLDVCKDGTVSYRERSTKAKRLNDAALPVFSVDTVEEARAMQVHFCAKQYTEHPKQPGRDWFKLPADCWGGEIDDLNGVSLRFLDYWEDYLVPKKTAPPPGSRWQHRRDRRAVIFEGLHFMQGAEPGRIVAYANYRYEATAGAAPGRVRGRSSSSRSSTPVQSMPLAMWLGIFVPVPVVSREQRAHMAQGRRRR